MSNFLFILRCYSGFEQSLIKNKWCPSGATTIVKTLEYIQNDNSSNLLLISSKYNSKLDFIRNKKLNLKKLNIPVHCIMGKLSILSNSKLGILYTNIYNSFSIIYYVLKFRPKIIYSDHANIFVTAFISRYMRIKTVVRLMGIKDDMRECLNGNSLYSRLLKWSYRSPFSMVIATQDGAGPDVWMDQALRKKVPRKTILNGVDRKSKTKKLNLIKYIPKNKFIVIFIGRLEEDKAPDKFLESFLLARNKFPNKFHCIIVGSGSMQEKLNLNIKKENAFNDVTFFSDINASNIFLLLSRSDIYVSLNRYGNLSNTNIEAMTSGKAMIIPKSKKENGIDVYTDSLIPNNSIVRVSNSDSVKEVAKAIIYLFQNKNVKNLLEKKISYISKKFIKNWDERIHWEFKLLSIINSGNKNQLDDYIEKN